MTRDEALIKIKKCMALGRSAEAFGCEHYINRSRKWTAAFEIKTTWQYVFVGLDAAPTLAGYAFDVLGRQCYRARAAHIKLQPKRCKPATKTARGDEFAIGWVNAAVSVVKRHAQPQRNEQLLLEYMAERHPNMTTIKARDSRRGKNVSGHAQEGYRQGQGAQLHHGVGQREQILIGGGVG